MDGTRNEKKSRERGAKRRRWNAPTRDWNGMKTRGWIGDGLEEDRG